MSGGHLLLIACGAGPAADLHRLVAVAHNHSWTAAVTTTPTTMNFIDRVALEALTGSPIRSEFRWTEPKPGGRALPSVDALIIAPATFNTINKLAFGIADNHALTSAAELIGRGVPTVVVPFVNSALAKREPFIRSVISLRSEGVRVLLGPEDGQEPHPPGTGASHQATFAWEAAFLTAATMAEHRLR